MQNAPDAPAPTGLQGVLGAVSSANAFRDMAGLAGTQANVRAAMEAASNLATNFGNQAAALKMADIADKARATQSVDQQLASIQRAKDLQLITPEEASTQANEVLKGLHSPGSSTAPHENSAVNRVIDTAGRTAGSVVEAQNQEGHVRVEMGKGTDVGNPEDGAEPAQEEDSEPPTKLNGLWFDDHGAEFGTDENFNVSGYAGDVLAMSETEHFKLGENLQSMIDYWASRGLIHGGCRIDTKAREHQQAGGSGLSGPIQDWDIFTPDRAKPTQPYHHSGFVRALALHHASTEGPATLDADDLEGGAQGGERRRLVDRPDRHVGRRLSGNLRRHPGPGRATALERLGAGR